MCTHRESRRSGQFTCLGCHAAYMRRWRAEHAPTDEQRRRGIARSYAHVYVKRGVLKRQPCERCGAEPAQMHHADYSKPLEVTWVCRPCHLSLHRGTLVRTGGVA